MRLVLVHQRCDEPLWRRPTRRTISTGSLPLLLCTWRCLSSKFRVDTRASPREQQHVPAVVSTARTVKQPVLSTTLPVANLAGEARLLSPVTRQVHVV